MNVAFSRAAAVFVAFALAVAQGSAAERPALVKTEINEVMQAFMTAWSKQASPQDLSKLLYDTSGQFALVGEGLKHPVERVPALMEEFKSLRPEWRPGCAFTLKGPVKQSGPLAATLNTLDCPATASAPAFNYYILLVWNRTPRGWRVVMESYSTYPAGRS